MLFHRTAAIVSHRSVHTQMCKHTHTHLCELHTGIERKWGALMPTINTLWHTHTICAHGWTGSIRQIYVCKHEATLRMNGSQYEETRSRVSSLSAEYTTQMVDA